MNNEAHYRSLRQPTFMPNPKVSIIKGNNRYQNIADSLNLIKNEVQEQIQDKQNIIIKPNFLYDDKPNAATNVQAVKATIDFVQQFTNQQITIAEAPFSGTVEGAVKNFNYDKELADYNIKYLDLNEEPTEDIEVPVTENELAKLKIAKPILESDFRISVCPPKTHDTVILTLGIKNLIVGSIISKDATLGHNSRGEIHGGYYKTNKILFELLKIIPPNLTVIDAWQVMEGDGPSHGQMADMGLALASLDPAAVDSVMAYLMGFDPDDIGYLYFVGADCNPPLGTNQLDKIEIIGNIDLQLERKKFEPHPDYERQLGWRDGLSS
ncbi:DUF362 domain-containing protein [Patescibacteria group bacterium]|nr:DUF362 domain-containing protein [Patescibacteria group bacterium]